MNKEEKDIIKFMDELAKDPSSSNLDREFTDIWNELPSANHTINQLEDLEENARFAERIEAYQAGLAAASERRDNKVTRFPWQQTLSIAALVIVSFGSIIQFYTLQKQKSETQELSKLLTLSLVNQELPSQRIDGVFYASRLDHRPDELVHELIEIIKTDPSSNVRLAAIESIASEIDRIEIREQLIPTLSEVESPLVLMTLANHLLQHSTPAEQEQILAELERSSIDEQRIESIRRQIQQQLRMRPQV